MYTKSPHKYFTSWTKEINHLEYSSVKDLSKFYFTGAFRATNDPPIFASICEKCRHFLSNQGEICLRVLLSLPWKISDIHFTAIIDFWTHSFQESMCFFKPLTHMKHEESQAVQWSYESASVEARLIIN